MSLADLIKVNITVASANPVKPGFGRALIMAANLPATFQGSTQLYADLEQMISDGFTADHPAYKAASVLASQAPRVSDWKIGRRSNATIQSLTITVNAAMIPGEKYSVQVANTTAEYTAGALDTPTTVAVALASLIDTDPLVVATSALSTISMVRSVAGGTGLTDVQNWTRNLSVLNTSADPGITADLDAVKAEDNDWFGLSLDSCSKPETLAAASWAEANRKIFAATTSDANVVNSAPSTNVASQLQAFSYANTHLQFSGKKLLSYADAAMLGAVFPDPPGTVTWKFKTLRGVPFDDRHSLTTGQSATARSRNCNVYTDISGLGTTEEGKSSSGEFMDITHFVFWLETEAQIRVFALLKRSKKVPFTDAGIEQIKTEVRGALAEGFAVGGLADAPRPEDVTSPSVATSSPLDRAARRLRPVKFTGRLAGAIHTLEIFGTLSV